jgi:phosphate transport system substrate-binding protein
VIAPSLLLAAVLLAGPASPLRAAGSGTALPAVRALAAAYQKIDPDFSLSVAESIGSTGAVLAVRDGAIELGLISRSLKADEQAGLCVVAFASDPVVMAASPDVRTPGLSTAQLLDIYRGDLTTWPGSDPPLEIRVLQREPGDSGSQVFASHIPGFEEAMQKALDLGRWRVLFHDAEMQQALLTTKGGIGVFDLGAIRAQKLPLHPLALDGVFPTTEALQSGRYPYAKMLSFVVRAKATRPAEVQKFLGFVAGPQGLSTLRQAGYGQPPQTKETCH